MNKFERRIAGADNPGLFAENIETIQVNVGLRCNQECRHCHIGASPQRTETMNWSTMQIIADVANQIGVRLVDITGGAPELNPHILEFIHLLRQMISEYKCERTSLRCLKSASRHLESICRVTKWN